MILDVVAKSAAAATAIGALWAGASFLDLQPVLSRDLAPLKMKIAEETKSLLLLQWQILDAKLKQNGTLEFAELQQYCSLSRELGFVRIPVCGL